MPLCRRNRTTATAGALVALLALLDTVSSSITLFVRESFPARAKHIEVINEKR